MRAYLFCLFIGVQCLTGVYAQTPGMHFRKLGVLNENSSDLVNDILKDAKGRVWIAAQIGFYRYDGAHFLEYRKTKDSTSLINNFVHALCEDKSGNIWGGTECGAFRFTPETQKFKRYYVPLPNSPQSITNIVCDNDGIIWGTSPYYLFKFNARADSFETVMAMHPNKDSLQASAIKGNGLLAEPRTKGIWLATRSGIRRYDSQTKKLLDYQSNTANDLFKRVNTGALAKASDGVFMYFDNAGKDIVRFDPVNQRILRRLPLKNKLPNAFGLALFESTDRKIWFSSWTDEVVVIDQQNGDSVQLLHTEKNEPLTIPSNSVWTFMQDEDGSVWLGTSSGIAVCNPDKSLYRIHRLEKQIPELDAQTSFYGFTEDPNDHTWWLLTSKYQLIHFNPVNGKSTTTHISQSIPDKQGKKPVYVRGINTFKGKLAVSTMEGTWLWAGNKQPLIPLENEIGQTPPITICRMIGNIEERYYMSDFKKIISWDGNTKTFSNIPKSQGHLFETITGLEPKVNYQQNRPVFANLGLGYIARVESDSLRPIKVVPNLRDQHSAYINDIDGDQDGNIWICHTGNGLIQYNSATGASKTWTETEGLSFNQVICASLDNMNNVWCVYRRYFSVLLAKTNSFYSFSVPLELQKSAWENFIYTNQNGHIIANNFNNLVEFLPDRLLLKPTIKLPEISALLVGDKLLPILPGNELTLNPNQNDIRIRFGLLTDPSLFPYTIQYKLDGADENWKTANGASEAVYNKLPSGKYNFRVKAIARNGEWETGERQLAIEILNPFYKSTWFLLLAACAILAAFFGIYRYRLQQHKQIFNLETKTSSLEREKATIQYDSLKQQLNPHFLFNSLTSLAGLIETDQEMASGFLQSMADMYRYILKNGEHETVLLKDEIKFAQLYIEIQQTRFGRGLAVNIDVPEDFENYRIAPVTLQNLIENAIKHNIIDTTSPLVIDIFSEKDYLVVRNNLQKKSVVETSNKTGLVQFVSLYKYLTNKPVIIKETETEFEISIPMV